MKGGDSFELPFRIAIVSRADIYCQKLTRTSLYIETLINLVKNPFYIESSIYLIIDPFLLY